MSFDVRYLDFKGAAQYIGQTSRWMRRHWPNLVREGVQAYRVPKDSKRGHLMFSKMSLDQWVESCRIWPPKDGHQIPNLGSDNGDLTT